MHLASGTRPPGETARAGGGFGAVAAGLLRACRPRQWLKNGFVLAAPAAAGVLTTAGGLRGSLIAVAAFCCAASGTYLFNDAADVAADRLHPRKRLRPIAAGIVPVRLARIAGTVLLVLGVLIALAAGWRLALVVACYLALTFAYTHWLKHQPVVDLVAVAACQVVRAFAGAVAVGVPVTGWFLVVVSLGSLLLVAGKRDAELRAQNGGEVTRATLAVYTPGYLAHVRAMSAGAVIVTYGLWALQEHTGTAQAFLAASLVPFVLMVLRHALLVERGQGEEPEELVLRDRPLQVFTAMTLLLLVLGIYLP